MTRTAKNYCSAYLLRLEHREKEAINNDVVGIGWSKCDGFLECDDWGDLKSYLASKDPYYASSPRALGNAAGSIWRFLRDIDEGALIVVPVANGFRVAEAVGKGPYYDPDFVTADFAWRRQVRWLTSNPIPRSFADNLLRRRLKARQTCVCLDDLVTSVMSALERKSALVFADEVADATLPSIYEKLGSAVDDIGLEKLVAKLASASGARATVQPKNQQGTGDFDVVAVYDLGIANEDATIRVAYQVKQHEGTTSEAAVQQLIDRLKADDADDVQKCVVVTTASEFSAEAEKLADANDIILLNRKKLAEWIITVGLSGLRDL